MIYNYLNILLSKKETLENLNKEIGQLNCQKYELSKKTENLQRSIKDKKTRLAQLEVENHSLPATGEKHKARYCVKISNVVNRKRKLKPSNAKLPSRAKYIRLNETWEVVNVIHGGTQNNYRRCFRHFDCKSSN